MRARNRSTERPCNISFRGWGVPVCVNGEEILKAKNKPGVILLHGIGGPNASLLRIMKHCREKGVNCISPSISGHGRSSPNRRFLHKTSAMDGVRDIWAVVEYVRKELEASSISLAGFSMGAFYQLLFLARKQEKSSNGKTGIDNNIFIAPCANALRPSLGVLLRHPIAYPCGLIRGRTDKIMQWSKNTFAGEDMSREDRYTYFNSLMPVSLRAYTECMFPKLLRSNCPKPGTIKGSAHILRAENDRLLKPDAAKSVGDFFKGRVHEQTFPNSHCGMLFNEEVADALCDVVLGKDQSTTEKTSAT